MEQAVLGGKFCASMIARNRFGKFKPPLGAAVM